jgi:hypothetical protein
MAVTSVPPWGSPWWMVAYIGSKNMKQDWL